jgi:hypothetical protein
MPGYATVEQFDELKASLMEMHELTRKLVNSQAIAIDRKFQVISKQLETFMSRKPDPTVIRDAWIRQIPRIREDVKLLSLEVAKLRSIADKKGATHV